ncbi:amidase family protein, partial [Nocardia vinacea]|uniref:amidase family protein n=1 Tax=Nocardia vinacea TaxID=96468 RepID=UPI0005954090
PPNSRWLQWIRSKSPRPENKNLALLFGGSGISAMGGLGLSGVIPPLVYNMSGSAELTGLATAATQFAALLAQGPAGELADMPGSRDRLRKLSAIGAAVAAVGGGWVLSDMPGALEAVIGSAVVLQAIDTLAATSTMIYGQRLAQTKAQKKASITLSLLERQAAGAFGRFIFPALEHLSSALPFFADAASYAVNRWMLNKLPPITSEPTQTRLLDGVRALWRDPYLRDTGVLLFPSTLALWSGGVQLAEIINTAGYSATTTGLLLSSSSTGVLLAAAAATRKRFMDRISVKWMHPLMLTAFGGLMAEYATTSNPWIIWPTSVVTGSLMMFSNQKILEYQAEVVPAGTLGKANAAAAIVGLTGGMLGSAFGGFLLERAGGTATGLTNAALLLGSAAASVVIARITRSRHDQQNEPGPAGDGSTTHQEPDTHTLDPTIIKNCAIQLARVFRAVTLTHDGSPEPDPTDRTWDSTKNWKPVEATLGAQLRPTPYDGDPRFTTTAETVRNAAQTGIHIAVLIVDDGKKSHSYTFVNAGNQVLVFDTLAKDPTPDPNDPHPDVYIPHVRNYDGDENGQNKWQPTYHTVTKVFATYYTNNHDTLTPTKKNAPWYRHTKHPHKIEGKPSTNTPDNAPEPNTQNNPPANNENSNSQFAQARALRDSAAADLSINPAELQPGSPRIAELQNELDELRTRLVPVSGMPQSKLDDEQRADRRRAAALDHLIEVTARYHALDSHLNRTDVIEPGQVRAPLGRTIVEGLGLPATVAAAEIIGEDPTAALLPQEQVLIDAIESDPERVREREIVYGRTCAHRALARLGGPVGPVLRAGTNAPGGLPLWQPGVVGSISHRQGFTLTDRTGYYVAAVSRHHRSIGIDTEHNEPLSDVLRNRIALPEEQAWLGRVGTHRSIHWDRVLFSAKESVYKAWYPLTNRYLDFEDALITFDLDAGTFHAQLLVADRSTHDGPPLTEFDGHFAVEGGVILTGIAVPQLNSGTAASTSAAEAGDVSGADGSAPTLSTSSPVVDPGSPPASAEIGNETGSNTTETDRAGDGTSIAHDGRRGDADDAYGGPTVQDRNDRGDNERGGRIPAGSRMSPEQIQQLVKQLVAQGHPQRAIRLIQQEYGARVFGWVSANIGEHQASRDITDEACTQAVHRFTQIGNLSVEEWVVRNARNLMREHRGFVRFRQRIRDIFIAGADVEADGTASRALAAAERTRIQACVRATLTPDQQRKITELWQTRHDASTEPLPPADVRRADPVLWAAVRKLAVAITAAHAGTDLATARATAFVKSPGRESPQDDSALALSEQELEILQLVAQGLFPHEIGKVLRISHTTVEEALAHISDELGVDGLTAMLDTARHAHRIDDEQFTPTSQQIRLLDLVADGKTNNEIGEILGLTPGTVNVYLNRLEAEFGTGTRAGLTAVAIRMRIIEHRGARTADGASTGDDLDQVELDLLVMTANGMSNRVIADVLGIHEVSVGRYYRRIKAKLGTESRAAMVAMVMPRIGAVLGDSELSDRDKDVLRLIVNGVPNTVIGNELGMPASAVLAYRARIAVKLDSRSLNAMIESGRHPELHPSPAGPSTPNTESTHTTTDSDVPDRTQPNTNGPNQQQRQHKILGPPDASAPPARSSPDRGRRDAGVHGPDGQGLSDIDGSETDSAASSSGIAEVAHHSGDLPANGGSAELPINPADRFAFTTDDIEEFITELAKTVRNHPTGRLLVDLYYNSFTPADLGSRLRQQPLIPDLVEVVAINRSGKTIPVFSRDAVFDTAPEVSGSVVVLETPPALQQISDASSEVTSGLVTATRTESRTTASESGARAIAQSLTLHLVEAQGVGHPEIRKKLKLPPPPSIEIQSNDLTVRCEIVFYRRVNEGPRVYIIYEDPEIDNPEFDTVRRMIDAALLDHFPDEAITIEETYDHDRESTDQADEPRIIGPRRSAISGSAEHASQRAADEDDSVDNHAIVFEVDESRSGPPFSAEGSIPRKAAAQRPVSTDAELNAVLDDVYMGIGDRNQVGDGTLMDAVRNEVSTGQPTRGRWHRGKATETAGRLRAWLAANLAAPQADRDVAQNLIGELDDVVRGATAPDIADAEFAAVAVDRSATPDSPVITADGGTKEPDSTATTPNEAAASDVTPEQLERSQGDSQRPGQPSPPTDSSRTASTPATTPALDLLSVTGTQLAALMDSEQLTSVQLTQLYLERNEALSALHAVIAINPHALDEARRADELRHVLRQRGITPSPLLGMPVIVKGNIDIEGMPTTAGSSALANSFPIADATLVTQLRAAGAVILGHANLTEFAGYSSRKVPHGYSSYGGQTLNAHEAALTPGGSSSGSAVSVAAGGAPLAIGTQTFGSILAPCNYNSVVGLKPTVGAVPRTGIVPIATTRDTAGPITADVTDAAVLLTALVGIDPQDPATAHNPLAGHDFTQDLNPHALRGARLGVLEAGIPAEDEPRRPLWDAVLDTLKAQGATLITVDLDLTDSFQDNDPPWSSVFTYEFKRDMLAYLSRLPADAPIKTLADLIAHYIADTEPKYGNDLLLAAEAIDLDAGSPDMEKYLAGLQSDLAARTPGANTVWSVFTDEFVRHLLAYRSGLPADTPIRTLADLIAHYIADTEPTYGHDLLLAAEAIDLDPGSPDTAKYLADLQRDLAESKSRIDAVMAEHNLTALVSAYNYGTAMGDKAGYPGIIVPAGRAPADTPGDQHMNVTFRGGAWSEPTLISYAYAFEQAHAAPRPRPQFTEQLYRAATTEASQDQHSTPQSRAVDETTATPISVPPTSSNPTETARERIGLRADADPMPSAADRNVDVEQNLAFLARHHDHFPVEYTTDPGLVYIPDPGHPPTEVHTTGITPRGEGPLTTYRDIDQARRWSVTGRVYVARPEAGFLRADPDRSVQLIGGINGSRILGYYHFGPEVPLTLPYGFTTPAQQAGDWIPNTVHGDAAPPPLPVHNSADSPTDATESIPVTDWAIDDNQLALDLDGPLYVAAEPVDLDGPLYVADPENSVHGKIGDERATVEERSPSDSENVTDAPDYANMVVGLAAVIAEYPNLRDVFPSAPRYQSLGSDEGEVMPTFVALALRDAAVKFGQKVSGNYNDVYLLGEFAIRIPRADAPDQLDFVLWPKEYQTLEAIARDAPRLRHQVPQVLHVELDAQDDLVFEIQRRIHGEPVADLRDKKVMNTIYSVAGELMQVAVPQDSLPLPADYPESGDSEGFFRMLIDHIERLYQRYRAIPKYRAMFDDLGFPELLHPGLESDLDLLRSQPFRLLHGDLTKENVLESDVGVMIVDFGLAMFGPSDYEAAIMRHRSPGTVHAFDDLPPYLIPYARLLDQMRVLHDTIRLVDETATPEPDPDKTFRLVWNVIQALGIPSDSWPGPRPGRQAHIRLLNIAAHVRKSAVERDEPVYVVAGTDGPAPTMSTDSTPDGSTTDDALPGPTPRPKAMKRTAPVEVPDYIRKCLVQTVRASWAVGYDQATIPHENADTWDELEH